MEKPEINKNIFNWSGFHESAEKAQQHLEDKTKIIAIKEKKLIISSKKELLDKKCHNLLLYRFTIKTIDNNEK
jgi:hypothetical protein